MADLAYREIYAMNAVEARRRLVRTYQETGSVGEAVRLWHTFRQDEQIALLLCPPRSDQH